MAPINGRVAGDLKRALPWLVSALTSWLAFRQLDLAAVLQTVTQGDIPAVAGSVVCVMGAAALLALRWRLLLARQQPRYADAFRAISIGYLANAVLPMRMGELVRVTVLAHATRGKAAAVLGSVVVERTMDALILALLGAAASVLVVLPGGIGATLRTALGVALVCVLLVVALARIPASAVSFGRSRLAVFLARTVDEIRAGVSASENPRRLLAAFGCTVAGWISALGAWLLLLNAFDLPATLTTAAVVLFAANMAAAIPSSPGAIGVFEYAVLIALSGWVPDETRVMAFAITSHAVLLGTQVALGIGSVLSFGTRLDRRLLWKLRPDPAMTSNPATVTRQPQ